ncbi:DUF2071 domain-containing protein [Bacillus sonorensis]|uniref:YqjF family protein n=1 Tax=Bacillus sonorensis TaxID=119858 RepID=UPI001F27289D|nr:DUF2071 domain-containing protein [Bacillus sonorensis]MCF7616314.1 DUF2071 domain-containing protein [Bacillus sonorensis]MCY8023670.1 DUF2071 domain-containing protein [Bacillus sonorensis]MCY8032920.1 DUF2071 domain-containing protein [Bacillus sonorensis]MCY8089270.1 DUF2071 domain-containing protein [Bacillus sonorensis]MCZ0068456.1 DUF2071 domain-containing protein [Bacillus sonorensis]
MIMNTSHRPFPLPKGPWMMTQTWNDVLFAHWAVEPQSLRGIIPAALELETCSGKAWISILPFLLTNLRPRFLPPLPFISRFPELNVRTYVTYRGIPGIYFFSLDAASRLAVLSARTFFHLPYFHADMDFSREENHVQFTSRRYGSDADFRARYRPLSDPFTAQKGTLDYWLTERYRLYTVHNGRVYYEDIHHSQWPLQQAEADFHQNQAAAASGLSLPDTAPLLHYAKKQHVLFWPLQQAR